MQDFQSQFDKAINEYATKNQYSLSRIPSHLHNGSDTNRLDPQHFLGFPTILVTDSTIAPIDTPTNGTIRILYDTNSWNLWIRVANLWKTVSLT